MNKLVKGSIAGAAGIALLLGGAGTLATWNSSVTVASPGSIAAGTLDIAAVDGDNDGWTLSGSIADAAATPSAFTIVPGDDVTYTKSFEITATGDNLAATVELGDFAIVPVDENDDADVELADLLTASATFTVDTNDTASIVASTGVQTVVVSVTINFPSEDAGDENDAKLGNVSLDEFTITVTQD